MVLAASKSSRRGAVQIQEFFAFAFDDEGLMAKRERALRRAGVVAKPRRSRTFRHGATAGDAGIGSGCGSGIGSGDDRDAPAGDDTNNILSPRSSHKQKAPQKAPPPRIRRYAPPEVNAKVVDLYYCDGCGNRVGLSPCVICAGLKEAKRMGKVLPWWEREKVTG